MKQINDKYSITKSGKVFSKTSNRFIKPSINGAGYLSIYIGEPKKQFVHRIMARVFLGASGSFTVNHKNGIKTDNRLKNLEVFTSHADQIFHSRNTLNNKGKSLTVDDVVKIIKLRSTGFMVKDIASKFNITRHAVSGICTGRYWPSKNYPKISEARKNNAIKLRIERFRRVENF